MTDNDRSVEFDCCECGRHIVQMCGPLPDPRLCGCCLMLPGWFEVPEIRKMLDPGGLTKIDE